MSARTPVVILGAGGRDFHVFNTCYRDDASREVVAFTAAQIPHIDDRTYPPELAGPLYPKGIPIVPESDLETLLRKGTEVIFAYSDVRQSHVDEFGERVRQAGASFASFDPEACMLRGERPCVAVCAVRTGCGKSGVTRFVAAELRRLGKTPVVVRHPMPYGNLAAQVVQRFATMEDLDRHRCTIEEREEYEPHLEAGNVVFAGADYARALEAAEAEGDVVLWDGGNNDAPFVVPDLLITLVDPLRPGHELAYFPGRWNLEHADVVVVAKTDAADEADIETVLGNVARTNAGARVVRGRSPVALDDADAVRGRRALVVEDGPTVTHGEMGFGAGYVAATRAGAVIVDPRPFARGGIAAAFEAYPHLHDVVPALGYAAKDLADLEATIAAADCDVVVIGTPIDLARVVRVEQPCVRARYRFEDAAGALARLLEERCRRSFRS